MSASDSDRGNENRGDRNRVPGREFRKPYLVAVTPIFEQQIRQDNEDIKDFASAADLEVPDDLHDSASMMCFVMGTVLVTLLLATVLIVIAT